VKHLIRFNESLQELESLEKILNDYFAELIDESVAEVYIEEPEKRVLLSVLIEMDEMEIQNYDCFIKYINNHKKITDILEEVNIGILRLKNDYSNIDFDLNIFDNCEIIISFYPSIPIEGDFYKKRGNKIILDKIKTRKILNLDKDVNIHCYDNFLYLYFKNQNHFDKYINNQENSLILNHRLNHKSLNKIFYLLKIDGENIVKSINSIDNGRSQTSYINGVRTENEFWSITLELDNKYKFE
jgi:hypothetical protein